MLRDVTLLIKTFERPQCLRRLLKSIGQYYPELPIHLADDSREPLNGLPGIAKYIRLPYDSGVSVGRNTLLDSAATPFVVLLDDDFIFTKETSLELMRGVFDETQFNLVGGRFDGVYGGIFELSERQITIRINTHRGIRDGYPVIDYARNFFMARTEAIRAVRWDPILKVYEHADFFLRGREQLSVTHVKSCVRHQRSTGSQLQDKSYDRMRRRSELRTLVCQRYGVDRIVWKRPRRPNLGTKDD